MRIVSSFALAVFLASTTTSIDAFGPAVPLRATPFGVASSSMSSSTYSSSSTASSSSATLTMRIGFNDLGRKQRINEILHSNPTQEVVQTVLLSLETSAVIQKCNWKVRNSLIRKVRIQAARYGLPVDPKFGLPPTQIERETTEREQSVIRKQERVAAMATAKAQVLARQEARQVKRAANKARAAEFSKKLKVEREARQAAKQEAEPKPQPVVVVDSVQEEVTPVVEEVVAVAEPVAEVPAPEPIEEPVVEEEPAVPEPVAETSEPEPETPVAVVPEPVAEPAATTTTTAAAPAGGEITPKTIKALRDATGAGMMDCKNALIESDGDQEAAAEYLRKKGLAKADKKASRVAAEGRIAVATSGNKAVMVEVNCETDFVAKDDSFLGFCEKVASAAVAVTGDDVAGLMATEVDGEALETTRQGMVAKIGENIQVRRMASRGGEGSTVGAYVHMNRMGVLVELEGGSQQLCVDVAMHIAAMNPPYATPDDVPAEVLQKEKKLLTEQALESGKPPEIVEKMVEGRIRKYLEDICLVSQSYVRDGDKTVGKLLEENGAKIIGFTRLAVGEGIEKKEDDFAAEVAKMAGIKTETPAPAAESPAPEVQEKAPAPEPKPVAEAQVDEAPAAPSAAGGEVTPKTIKQLRDATGAGMMDCKKALIEANGDQEVAAENLRKKGLSKADKKASRIAAEGKIMIANSGNKGVMVEINCETDFVAKDGSFLGFCEKVAGAAIAADSDAIENLMATEVEGESLEATRQAMVAKIGENIQVRRMASRGGEGRTVGGYVHMNTIGVLVELEGGNQQLCTDVAMHIAAMNPPFATADDVPAEVLEKERRILSEQALESGKKPEIVEKMVEGRIRKFLEEKCLVSQPYVKDGDKTVGKLLEENGAKIIGFTRLVVGEGIEKKQDDFAAEVAKMAGIKSNEPEPAAV